MALRSDDELFHVTLYSWLISMQLEDRVVEVRAGVISEGV